MFITFESDLNLVVLDLGLTWADFCPFTIAPHVFVSSVLGGKHGHILSALECVPLYLSHLGDTNRQILNAPDLIAFLFTCFLIVINDQLPRLPTH